MSNIIATKTIAQLIAMTPAQINALTPAEKGARTRRINANPLDGTTFAKIDNSSVALSMIDGALTGITSLTLQGKPKKFTELGGIVQRCKVAVPASYKGSANVLSQIGQTFLDLRAKRKVAAASRDLAEMSGEASVGVTVESIAPSQLIRMVTQISNKMCWNVRRRLNAIQKDLLDRELTKIMGMDYTEAESMEMGIECTETPEELVESLEEACRMLGTLYSNLCKQVSGYMVPEPYAMFTQSAPTGDVIDGYPVWEVTFASNSYDEIAGEMEDILVRSEQEDEITARDELVLMDYTQEPVAVGISPIAPTKRLQIRGVVGKATLGTDEFKSQTGTTLSAE